MNGNDAAIIKTLAELGLRQEQPLTPEQEQLLKRALDPHEEYLAQVQQLFSETNEFRKVHANLQTMYRTQRFWSVKFKELMLQFLGLRADLETEPIRYIGKRDWWESREDVQELDSFNFQKFMSTYDSMIKAKKAFEKAGGDYHKEMMKSINLDDE